MTSTMVDTMEWVASPPQLNGLVYPQQSLGGMEAQMSSSQPPKSFLSHGMRQHRGAIALNNMGAALMEKRAFREAILTLKDSLGVVKGLLEETEDRERQVAGNSQAQVDVDALLKIASRRIFDQQSRPRPPQELMTVVVLDDDDLPSLRDALSQQQVAWAAGQPSSTVNPIRIECNSCIDDEEVMDTEDDQIRSLEYKSTIILYNLALAHMCMARLVQQAAVNLGSLSTPNATTAAQLKCQKMLRIALGLFHSCQPVLYRMGSENGPKVPSRNSDDQSPQSSPLSLFARTKMQILEAVVLSSMVFALSEMGQSQPAQQASLRLRCLVESLQRLDGFGILDHQMRHVAGAA